MGPDDGSFGCFNWDQLIAARTYALQLHLSVWFLLYGLVHCFKYVTDGFKGGYTLNPKWADGNYDWFRNVYYNLRSLLI